MLVYFDAGLSFNYKWVNRTQKTHFTCHKWKRVHLLHLVTVTKFTFKNEMAETTVR